MKTKVTILMASMIAIQGCTGSPIRVAGMDSESLSQQADETLCAAYGELRLPKVKSELIRRGTVRDWPRIDSKTIQLGDSRAEVLCAYGVPVGGTRSYANHYYGGKVWIYRHGMFRSFVYIESGRVVGWN